MAPSFAVRFGITAAAAIYDAYLVAFMDSTLLNADPQYVLRACVR
jgi:hypothetical protein